jgi:2-methylaconitate cis-trans-isomerase PrpF
VTQGVRCMLMRGGTSKGRYFLAGGVPARIATASADWLRDLMATQLSDG